MHVKFGDKTLIESLTIIVPGVGTADVVLGEPPETLTFLLQFEKDPDKKQEDLQLQAVDKTTARLIFRNWDNVLGTGLLEPIEIGIFRRRKLYLLLFVRKIGTKGEQKLVTLSFYSGEEVPGGEN